MAEQLTRYAPLLYVDPPLSVHTARGIRALCGVGADKPTVVMPRLARLSPVATPAQSRYGVWRITESLLRRALRTTTAQLGGDVHAVVAATSADVLGACGERRRVLYGTDDLVAGSELLGIPRARLEAQERRLLGKADVVVAVSSTLVSKWTQRGVSPILIPNGCDTEFLADVDETPAPDDVDLPSPIAGLVGYISERVDFRLLREVADAGTSLLLVGPTSPGVNGEMRDLLARDNVRWVGPKPYDSLKSYLRIMDVGLVPYADTPFNRGSFPLKLLEYLAAGRGVVATDLPSVRSLGTELIDIASTGRSFAAAVTRRTLEGRTQGLTSARRAFAAQHSWARRAQDFAEAIGIA
jgi:teichuronic acid biosynthesis glycosyltransferase TuaH